MYSDNNYRCTQKNPSRGLRITFGGGDLNEEVDREFRFGSCTNIRAERGCERTNHGLPLQVCRQIRLRIRRWGDKLIDGEYRTAINIFTPHEDRDVNWEWDVTPTHGATNVAAPGPSEPLGIGGAFEIDCELLTPWSHEEGYAKGFVFILSRWALDIAAVYTAGSTGGGDTAVSSIDIEYVLGHRLAQNGHAGKPEY